MKTFAAIVASLLAILAVTWVAQGNDFFLYKVFAPKYEQVRRETFEQSKAYRQGMVQELQNMEYQYVQATDSQKQALATIILRRAVDMPEDAMPYDLRVFIQELRQKQLNNH